MDKKNTLLIFDYDGTINDTMGIYAPAVEAAGRWLSQQGFDEYADISSQNVKKYLGMNPKEMWDDFYPSLPPEVAVKGLELISREMEKNLLNGLGRWYEGAGEVLEALKKSGYSMVILSNSMKNGAKMNWEHYNMGSLFEKWYDSESFNFLPKTEIIKTIVKEYPADRYIYVGDRDSDLLAAKEIGAKFIACDYGFGSRQELLEADFRIDDVRQLTGILGIK